MKKILLCLALCLLLVGCTIEHRKVWEDNKVSATCAVAEPATPAARAEIYLDASGSMKPYFQPSVATDLCTTLAAITNLNVSHTSFFWQDYPTPWRGDIAKNITNIKRQPAEKASSFDGFFKTQADRIATTDVMVYLVTDAIMSEGPLNMNLKLKALEGKVRAAVEGHHDLAVAILRYNGGYHGDYWNQNNQRVTAAQCPLLRNAITRPYYIIALGRASAVRWLREQSAEALNHPEGTLFLGCHDMRAHQRVLLDKGDSAAVARSGEPATLILELPACLKTLDAKRVKVMNNGNPLGITVTNDNGILTAVVPYVGLKPLPDGRVTISLVVDNELPREWTTTWNAVSDVDGPDETTTYSLSTLVKGLYNGIEDASTPLLRADFTYEP